MTCCQGVHVFLVIVDGMVDLATTRARMPSRPDAEFLNPDAIAQTYWDVANQVPARAGRATGPRRRRRRRRPLP